MPFVRFDDIERGRMTPNLSSAEGPIIEGEYMYFCNVFKKTGTGSELHYHPNELLIFPLGGKTNAVVGKDRRIIEPGTFVHVPAFARHSIKATEEGPISYLYVKDQTWTVVGVAADEAPPEEAISVNEINRQFETGEIEDRKNKNVGPDSEKSLAIIEGLGDCFYPILESFDEPCRGYRRVSRIEGERLAFEFAELPPKYASGEYKSANEKFMYIINGQIDVTIGSEKRTLEEGDIAQICKGDTANINTSDNQTVRYAAVESMPFLERKVDLMRSKNG